MCQKATCRVCELEICTKCHRRFHDGQSCNEFQKWLVEETKREESF